MDAKGFRFNYTGFGYNYNYSFSEEYMIEQSKLLDNASDDILFLSDIIYKQTMGGELTEDQISIVKEILRERN